LRLSHADIVRWLRSCWSPGRVTRGWARSAPTGTGGSRSTRRTGPGRWVPGRRQRRVRRPRPDNNP